MNGGLNDLIFQILWIAAFSTTRLVHPLISLCKLM